MTDIADEKAPFVEAPPAYEGGKVDPEAEAGSGSRADAHTRKRHRLHRLAKVFTLVGITALLLRLFHGDWREPRTHEIMDHSDLRKRRIDTGSQSLDADFDLLDLLSIRSWSGSLNVGIHPKPADKAAPEPAEVLIDSHSGSVNVDFDAFDAPARDYHVSIKSHSGSVSGTILHGRSTSIATNSARIDAQFALYAAGDNSSALKTTSASGSQSIALLSPAGYPRKSIKEMSSVHSTQSGSLSLRYPGEWEGTIEGHTQSGSLQLHGRDIDIIRRSSYQSSGHYVLAKKGKGNSTLSFHTGSGSVNIYFD